MKHRIKEKRHWVNISYDFVAHDYEKKFLCMHDVLISEWDIRKNCKNHILLKIKYSDNEMPHVCHINIPNKISWCVADVVLMYIYTLTYTIKDIHQDFNIIKMILDCIFITSLYEYINIIIKLSAEWVRYWTFHIYTKVSNFKVFDEVFVFNLLCASKHFHCFSKKVFFAL